MCSAVACRLSVCPALHEVGYFIVCGVVPHAKCKMGEIRKLGWSGGHLNGGSGGSSLPSAGAGCLTARSTHHHACQMQGKAVGLAGSARGVRKTSACPSRADWSERTSCRRKSRTSTTRVFIGVGTRHMDVVRRTRGRGVDKG